MASIMDVRGHTKWWDDRDRYYSQENNPTEAYNKARLEMRATHWLETCGPTAAVNCMSSLGKNLTISCPGRYSPQPEEVLMDYFNDPRNEVTLQSIRDLGERGRSIPENQVPQYYPVGVREVFGVSALFCWGASRRDITSALDRGCAVQLCLVNPGHYIAVVAYTDDFLVYHDSWGSQYPDGGFARKLTYQDLKENIQPYRIVYR